MLKLSIIVPVYNGEKYILDCIKSIINNNFNDFEVIIINDGSKDNTKKIVNSIKDDRIRLFDNNNYGVSYSRNFGLSKARGEFVMFVDADDFLSDEWHTIVFDNISDDITIFSQDKISNQKQILIKQICGVNDDGTIIAGPFSKIYKRQIIEENKIYFDEEIINGEDMLFNLQFIVCSSKFNIISKSFYKYRVNYGSATKSFNEKILLSDIKFHKELEQLINDNDIKTRLGSNGLFIIVDRISYIKKYRDAKKWFEKIDLEFYKHFDDKNLDKFKKAIVRRAKNKRFFLNYYMLYTKHIIISKIRKEYIRDI